MAFLPGVITLMDKGEHLNIYNIGTMDEISIKNLAILVGKVFGKKFKVVPGELAPGSTPRRCPDISKIQKLGFQPKVSLESGIRILVDWYKTHAYEEQKII